MEALEGSADVGMVVWSLILTITLPLHERMNAAIRSYCSNGKSTP